MERNALRAKLVRRAQEWRWGSLWYRQQKETVDWLADWPVARPRQWLRYVNQPETEAELAALRVSVMRGSPFGQPAWQEKTARRLGLEATLRQRGRPRKQAKN